MYDPYYPGAMWWPGYNAGYRAGRSRIATPQGWTVRHYTVGRDSTAIGLRGYFHHLQQRGGGLIQFAEEDGVTWHCGEGNPYGSGTEVEYHPAYDGDVILTPAAIASQRLHIAWRTLQWGVPTVQWPASWGRIPPGSHHGYVDHGAIQQTNPHYDYWPEELWPLLTGEEDDMFTDQDRDNLNATRWLAEIAAVLAAREGNGGPGLTVVKWHDTAGDHLDVIGVADDGSVFTMAGPNARNYYISGPRAIPDPTRPRTQLPSRVDQAVAVIVNDGEVRFRTIAQDGPDGPGTGVIEHYWRRTDAPGWDESRWGSYPVVAW